jgi:tRNA nucleotidyltransferase (CCA-adding enzyme)
MQAVRGVSEASREGAAVGGDEVLRALAAQPGGAQLQLLAGERDDLALVGGAVRDLLLGRSPRELDVVVGDAAALAHELGAALGADTTLHGRFGTAVVEWDAGRVDLAERRAESYASPGALPDVRPGSTQEDLHRRDFTVNAIAVVLGGARKGTLESAEHALEDLAAGRLRVLHERSFLDDPTRLLRLARYSARLGFEVQAGTAELAEQALAGGALQTVSPARVGAELRLALAEADALAALGALSALGVLTAIDPDVAFDEPLARRALELLPDDGRPELVLAASLLLALARRPDGDAEARLFALLNGLEFTASEREPIMRSALAARALVGEIAGASKPSQLHTALFTQSLEAIALAGALSAREQSDVSGAVTDWFERLRHVRLAITGDDLLRAGIGAGPELGRRLDAALARKLDGELEDGAQGELAAALEARL